MKVIPYEETESYKLSKVVKAIDSVIYTYQGVKYICPFDVVQSILESDVSNVAYHKVLLRDCRVYKPEMSVAQGEQR